jgi:serine/threonine protein kinase
LEGRFRVVCKLGSGGFGEIYKVQKKKSGDFYAAKIEKAEKHQKNPMVFWESRLIHRLKEGGCVPLLHYFGTDKTDAGKAYHVMIMDLLGPSLEDLF